MDRGPLGGLTLADNPARAGAGTVLCRLDEIADPGARGFDFRQGEMVFAGFVVRKDGRVLGSSTAARTPAGPWPGADRYLTRDGERLFCGGHGALFRIEDGVCTVGPCAGDSLWPWPVTVDDQGIVRTV